MKKLIAVAALSLMCGSAFAQGTGPQPQTDTMQKPMDKGSMDKGSMGKGSMNDGTNSATTGMNDKGNPKKEMSKDGSPAAGSKEMKK